jgi:hypothetical protein
MLPISCQALFTYFQGEVPRSCATLVDLRQIVRDLPQNKPAENPRHFIGGLRRFQIKHLRQIASLKLACLSAAN